MQKKKQTQTTEKALLTALDLCVYLSCSKSVAYKLLNTEGFPTVRIGTRKYANKAMLDQWLNEQAEKGE